MTPIERAAKALLGDDLGIYSRMTAEQAVRIVLQAIREPSGNMFDAGMIAALNGDKKQLVVDMWRAMIDAALEEGPGNGR